mmetsp:Transcript_25052/g.39020  ORF Transcript_25052/g.39020 Transcript_25052/m.39020 type:complete len:216 (+) Transcript_25052:276-923(+)
MYCFATHISNPKTQPTLMKGPFDDNAALAPGIPPLETLIWWYTQQQQGQNPLVYPIPNTEIYKAYVMFRYAAILQAIYARGKRGTASSGGAAAFDESVVELFIHEGLRYAGLESLYHGQDRQLATSYPILPVMSNHALNLLERMEKFWENKIIPNEQVYNTQLRNNPTSTPQIVEDLKKEAKKEGLWNLHLLGERFLFLLSFSFYYFFLFIFVVG